MAESDPEKLELGRRLAEARDLAGLTQPTVAVLLTNAGHQSTKQAVSAWEKGRNVPDALLLKQLARLYDTTADALLGIGTRSAEAERLAVVFDSLPEVARAGFMEVCGPFLEKHSQLTEAELFGPSDRAVIGAIEGSLRGGSVIRRPRA
jgi:transcriptional regulator with XRE-family HTH domain